MNDQQLDALYTQIAEELDISDMLYDRAETSYKALGEYVAKHCAFSVNVYTQGSFMLGTVIRPVNDEDEYDLDLVIEVIDNIEITPKELKNLIGTILKQSPRYSSKLEEKKRCWRIEYSEKAQFHLDITPAIKINQSGTHIKITNKNDDNSYSYLVSNPKGYAEWFESRKKAIRVRKSEQFESHSIEPIKEDSNKKKTPLQKVIQILKRHRDIMFENDPENMPVSIIITTLASRAYNGEEGVFIALKRILESMDSFIQIKEGEYYITNPSNPMENFADKWNYTPKKVAAYYSWTKKARKDLLQFATTITDDYSLLEESLGETVISRAISVVTPITNSNNLSITEYNNPTIKSALIVSHRQKPPFIVPKHQAISIRATVTQNGSSWKYFNNGQPIPKNCSINFDLLVPPSLIKGKYSVMWQVVNTGAEALAANNLRGGFIKVLNATNRQESSLYTGKHFVQAFLLKQNKCIAMSGEFIVNIE
jgi:hypothetical protein